MRTTIVFELFVKHLDFIGVPVTNLDKETHKKYEYQFKDAQVNKHWLSFWATYNKGYNQALNDVICPLVRELKDE